VSNCASLSSAVQGFEFDGYQDLSRDRRAAGFSASGVVEHTISKVAGELRFKQLSASLPGGGFCCMWLNVAMDARVMFEGYQKGPTEMKTLKSWIFAVFACTVISSQANADVLMVDSLGGAHDVNSVKPLKSFDGLDSTSVETQANSSRARSLFVSGSLINKGSTGAWLISQCVRRDTASQPRKAEVNQLTSHGRGVTPIPPAGTETTPISTFANFVHNFQSRNESGVVQSSVHRGDEIVPRTSNMTLIGMIAFTLAGITAFISVSRNDIFGLTPSPCCSRGVRLVK